MSLECVRGPDRIPLDDAFEDVAMLVNYLHERPGSTRGRRAPPTQSAGRPSPLVIR